MTDFGAIASATIAYRFSVVAIGLIFAFLGYRLFRLGVYEKAGDLKATWKGASCSCGKQHQEHFLPSLEPLLSASHYSRVSIYNE